MLIVGSGLSSRAGRGEEVVLISVMTVFQKSVLVVS